MHAWYPDDDHSESAEAWRQQQKDFLAQADERIALHAEYTEQYIWEEFERYLDRLYLREQGQLFLIKGPHKTYIRFRRNRVIGGWWNASVMVSGWSWFPPGREYLKNLQGRVQRLWFNPGTGHWRAKR